MIDKIRVEFEMEQTMSPNSRRSSEEYYELKLQVRFKYFEDSDLIIPKVNKLVISKLEGINKIEELNNGFDIYFRSHGLKHQISRLFNKYFLCEEKYSKKIVGKDALATKDIWRHTLLINVLNLNSGDKVQIKGEEYYIRALNKNDLVLRQCENGGKKVVSYNKISEYFKLIEKNAISWKKEVPSEI